MHNKIQLKTTRRYKKREEILLLKMLTDVSKKNTIFIKTSMLLQTTLEAETHLTGGLTLKP
jgi:hypothetical protein